MTVVRWRRGSDPAWEARAGRLRLAIYYQGEPGFSDFEPWRWDLELDGEIIATGSGWSEDLVIADGQRALSGAIANGGLCAHDWAGVPTRPSVVRCAWCGVVTSLMGVLS